MNVKYVYDNGQILSADILDIKQEDILKSLQNAITNSAAFSLGCGYTVKPAIPHMIINAFKNLASVSFVTDYSFPAAEALKAAAANAAAAPTAAAGGAADATPYDSNTPK